MDGLDAAIPKLGIIAASQLDGSVSFYPVPHPKILRQMLAERVLDSDKPLFGEQVLSSRSYDSLIGCL